MFNNHWIARWPCFTFIYSESIKSVPLFILWMSCVKSVAPYETNICLVPKCDNSNNMKDLRPISLCNVLYKMVSELLANRLKRCLDHCVSSEQSPFVEGRPILDIVLIAMEIIHAMKHKTKGQRGDLALKIDISKAYDRVDWGFLRVVLVKTGFDAKWVEWMMM